jgi:hypothetical protein
MIHVFYLIINNYLLATRPPSHGCNADYKVFLYYVMHIHTYHLGFIPEGVAEVSQIFL